MKSLLELSMDKYSLFCLLVFFSLTFTSGMLSANPTGGQVVYGQAIISNPDALNTVINQSSQNLITNWQTFSIAQPETTTFKQPDSSAIALNRVIGGDPSKILGSLKANGQVFISNPSGILFGKNAQVNVHGLMATTHNISNEDFINSNYRFIKGDGQPNVSVINRGTIEAASYVALFGAAVENSGTIVAHLGSVALAAGNAATLDFNGDGLISFQVTADIDGDVKDTDGNSLNDRVKNSGLIKADGGQIQLTAQSAANVIRSIVNNEGIIEANTVSEQGGRIFLDGGDNGIVSNSGTLAAKGDDAGEVGGRIIVTGETVELNNALVDASGESGGGNINIGGGWQGSDASINNATNTRVDENTRIKADANKTGDGGTVVVWSDDTTEFHGQISATGGSESGNGGNAEISGKEHLLITGHADLRATNGAYGSLLLDPGNVSIQDGGNTNVNNDSFNDAYIIAQLAGGNLEISTSNASTGNETITVAGDTDITWSDATTLALTAGRNIVMNSGARIVNTSTSTTVFDAIVLNANQGAATAGNFTGIELNNATITSTNGDISLNGRGGDTGNNNSGVYLHSGSQITSTGIARINVTGAGGAGTNLNYGVFLDANTKITSDEADITITGTSVGTNFSNTGVSLVNAQVTSTGTAKINVTGTGGAGTSFNHGVDLNGWTAKITSVDGDISVMGTGGAGNNNNGVFLLGKAQITSTGTAKINVTGTGGAGTFGNHGVYLSNPDTKITSVDGDITVTGTGGAGSIPSNNGILLNVAGTPISSTGAKVTLTGTAGTGGNEINVNAATTIEAEDFVLNSEVVSTVNSFSVNATRSILLNSNAGITSTIGAITLKANQGATAFTGSFKGITLNNNVKITSADGDILLQGRGGVGSSGANYGIFLTNGAQIIGTSAAKINVTGTGGVGTDRNYGVFLLAGNTKITSVDGDIVVTGTGAGSGTDNHGILFQGSGTQISSTGAKVTLTGTAGTGGNEINIGNTTTIAAEEFILNSDIVSTTNNFTVNATRSILLNSGSSITSSTGAITLKANQAGTATSGNFTGIELNNAKITSTDGDILLQGRGGDSGNNNHGVHLDSASEISTTNADIAIVAAKGAGTSSKDFNNTAGAAAMNSTNGRWLIYSSESGNNTFGGLVAGKKRYNTSFNTIPATFGATDNGFLYSIVPTLTINADAANKTYGEVDPTLTFSSSGFIDGDTVASALTGSLARAAGEDVNTYAISQGSLADQLGYTINYTGENLTINQRAITLTANPANKTYGDVDPALGASITAGSLGSTTVADTLADVTGIVGRQAGENIGNYDVTLGTGSKAANYTITFDTNNNALTINQRALTLSADVVNKTYGDTDPTLGVSITAGSLGSATVADTLADVTGTVGRQAGENIGNYDVVLATGSKAANYAITFATSNDALTINPRAITVTANAGQSKIEGTTDPALTYSITNGSLAFTDSISGSQQRDAGETVGDYAINQGSLLLNDGNGGNNYMFSYQTNDFAIKVNTTARVASGVLLGLTPTGLGSSPFGQGGSLSMPVSVFPLRVGTEEEYSLYPWEEESLNLFGLPQLNMPPQMAFF
jgi:filamentous hemagglutinin family protein